MRRILLVPIITLIFVIGCSQQIICEKPYILVGTDCCLDKNDNSICDDNENSEEEVFKAAEKFARSWEQKDFGGMYDMFIPSLKKMKTKADFITILENKESHSNIVIRLDKVSLENENIAYAYYSVTSGLFATKTPAMKLESHNGQWLINAFADYFKMEELYLMKCNDNNICTTDTYSFKEGNCINTDLPKPCCGDGICNEKETHPYEDYPCKSDCDSETIYLGLGSNKEIIFLGKNYGILKYTKQESGSHVDLDGKAMILEHKKPQKIGNGVYIIVKSISNLDGNWDASFVIYKIDTN